MAKIIILPPFELFHPVLPYRCGRKLVFPLCRSCVETEMQKLFTERSCKCSHSNEDRALTGTWCTPEILKAQGMGYKIVTIHEVWHFPKLQQGLFSNYVNTWLKIKQESADYPAKVTTPEQKEQYIANYKGHENIHLDPEMVKKKILDARLPRS